MTNTKAWGPLQHKDTEEVAALLKVQTDALVEIHQQYSAVPAISDLSSDELVQNYLDLATHTSTYYACSKFEPKILWQTLRDSKQEDFGNLFLFIELCLCAPYSNAVVERFFNFMKVIKTDWRSRLGANILEGLLRVKIEGPDVCGFAENYRDLAVNMWWEAKDRRPNHQGKRSYKQREGKQKRQKMTNEFLDNYLSEED